MRMAKLIANERISYKVIPQSLPKIKFWQNQLSWGDAAIESGTSKNHYNIYLLFCIGVCKNVTVSVFIDLKKMHLLKLNFVCPTLGVHFIPWTVLFCLRLILHHSYLT